MRTMVGCSGVKPGVCLFNRLLCASLPVVLALLAMSCVSVPAGSGGDRQPSGSDSFIEALEIWEIDRQEEAIGLYRETLEAHAGGRKTWDSRLSAPVWYLLAKRYESVENYPEAANAYRMALELDPDFARALVDSAVLHENQLGDIAPEAVLAAYERAYRLRPRVLEYGLGYVSRVVWDDSARGQAGPVLEELLAAHPDNVQVWLATLQYRQLQGDSGTGAALERIMALATDSDDAGIMQHAAWILHELGFSDESRLLARMAMKHPGRQDWMLEYLELILAE